jgi:hypothetical protein
MSTQTPTLDVLHLPAELKQAIAQTWIANLHTEKQADTYFRVIFATGECHMCVVGVLLDACVQHGVGAWTCKNSTDGMQLCGFQLPVFGSDHETIDEWQSAMAICAQFGLLGPEDTLDYNECGVVGLPSTQNSVDLIVENDSGSTFDEMLPEIEELLIEKGVMPSPTA